MTTGSFQESRPKQIVREHWNTPVLKYLHKKYNVRFRYMGFPGTDLNDIKLWADMIEDVVAFELPCRQGADERSWVKQIRVNLRKLGIPGLVYFGPFEEVVILREDYDGQRYRQDKVITLYNLDFCDEIASRIETRAKGRRMWRFEALRQILHDQRECHNRDGKPSHFIILLTVRNQIESSRIVSFLGNNLLAETQTYCSTCRTKNPIPATSKPLIGTHAWALKAFLYNTLKTYFAQPNICALFFPLVKYLGTPITLKEKKLKSPMLHWMFLCRFGESEIASPAFYPANFLVETVSLTANNSGITLQPEVGEVFNSQQPLSPVEWFQPFEGTFLNGLRF